MGHLKYLIKYEHESNNNLFKAGQFLEFSYS